MQVNTGRTSDLTPPTTTYQTCTGSTPPTGVVPCTATMPPASSTVSSSQTAQSSQNYNNNFNLTKFILLNNIVESQSAYRVFDTAYIESWSNQTATGIMLWSYNHTTSITITSNMSLMNEWQYPPTSLNPYDPCGAPSVVGFAVIHGYYDLSNYTDANALTLYNTTFAYTCSTTYVGDYHYLFPPDSNVAIISYSGQTLYNFSTLLSFSTKGYWTGGYGVGVGSATFHDFPQGTYTVLAADEWG